MGFIMNKIAYVEMVEQDIDWLMKQPRTLEREHIVAVLRNSVEMIYGKLPPVDGTAVVRLEEECDESD